MSEEEKGFTVKDKRLFSEEGEAAQASDTEATEEAVKQEQAPLADAPGDESGKDQETLRDLPPVDFSSFIYSLSHAAIMHLGQIPDPVTGETRTDLAMARHTIDTLGMLQEKTEGNLDPDEKTLLDNVLTQLRLVFVQQG